MALLDNPPIRIEHPEPKQPGFFSKPWSRWFQQFRDHYTRHAHTVTDGTPAVDIGNISWSKHTADAITLTAGTTASSVLADLQTINDGNFYHIDEAAATPGIDFMVEFQDVEHFVMVKIVGGYAGSATHGIAIQLYNWVAAGYETHNNFQTQYVDVSTAGGYILQDRSFFIYSPTNYIGTGANLGKVRVRFYHTPAGNASHDLYLDVVALYQ